MATLEIDIDALGDLAIQLPANIIDVVVYDGQTGVLTYPDEHDSAIQMAAADAGGRKKRLIAYAAGKRWAVQSRRTARVVADSTERSALADAVAAAFATESVVVASIESDTITTEAQIDDAEWPV